MQAFQNDHTCKELEPCIWSFINVFKRLLKNSRDSKTSKCGAHGAWFLLYTCIVFISCIIHVDFTLSPPEILQKLLVAFDPHLTILVSNFLPEEKVDEGPSGVYLPNNTHSWGVTFSSLLALLELLCASRLTCSAGVCPQSQRLVYTRGRALIKTAASSSSDYYVKRQVLLLMKRTLLQKAGEDFAFREISTTASRDEHFGVDMESLADTVLRAVSAGWLQFVPVETASSFGGSSQGDGQSRKPDHVMLRAVGLVVLKSLELAIQTGAGNIITFIMMS